MWLRREWGAGSNGGPRETSCGCEGVLSGTERSVGEAHYADPIHKLEAEIDAARTKAVADFDEMRKAGVSAFKLDHALAALDELEKKFSSVLAAAKADAAVAEAAKLLPSKISATGTAPQLSAPSTLPVLGGGGTAGAQFDVFSKDQLAQDKLAAQAYQDITTPAEKFALVEKEINLLLEAHKIDQTAAAAAMQKAREEMAKSTDQLEKLLEKTGSAKAGMQAFFLQLETQGGKRRHRGVHFRHSEQRLAGLRR